MFFALGIAILMHNTILRRLTYCSLFCMLIITTFLYIYTRAKLRNKLNEMIYSLVNETLDINNSINLINSILFNDRSLLGDMLKTFISDKSKFRRLVKYIYSALLFIGSGILLLLWLAFAFSMLNHGVLSKFLSINITDGYTLMILSWLLMTMIIQDRSTSHTEHFSGPKQDLQHFTYLLFEKYTYENIARKRTTLLLIVYSIIALIPTLRINIKKFSFWFDLYICNSKLYDLIEELERAGRTYVVEGDPVLFFECKIS